MKEKLYICNICEHRFSRKSNAFRHNLAIHNNLGTIVRDPSLQVKNKPRGKEYTKDFEQTKRFNSKYQTQKENDSYQVNYFTSYDTDDWKIYKVLGQLIKPYLELEKELGNINPIDKSMILSDSFLSSLNSYNPVKSLSDIAELYSSMKALDIIATNLHQSKGIFKEVAEFKIKESIKNCSLFG